MLQRWSPIENGLVLKIWVIEVNRIINLITQLYVFPLDVRITVSSGYESRDIALEGNPNMMSDEEADCQLCSF